MEYEQCEVRESARCPRQATETVKEPFTPREFKTRCCEPCAMDLERYGYVRVVESDVE